ncbi:uncharacterized protein LOC135348918 [Halichondria panicea]|uniref:uncharacterized protein LOC135348918 n=1 Tax=Halichondria panicea TaxID=6063 RepID=UPI00312B2D6F
MKLDFVLLVVCVFAHCVVSQIELKVGLYNSIPDLNDDGLKSLKDMVERGFSTDDHSVNAIVSTDEYDPYLNLSQYLQEDGFDLIEIDTVNIAGLVSNKLITPMHMVVGIDTQRFIKATVDAVSVSGVMYGVPTYACGNFLIALSPGSQSTCDLSGAIENNGYSGFEQELEICKDNLVTNTYERLYAGKISDKEGWYLPFYYLDAWIDSHNPKLLRLALAELEVGVIDRRTCNKLSTFAYYCTGK